MVRKETEGVGTSQGMQVRGLSQKKDDDDDLTDESSDASKTAPWATEAKEVGTENQQLQDG